jgi:hypothetical protein
MSATKFHTHTKQRAKYLYRFKIIEAPNCPCGNDNQTTDYLLLECALLQEDRERLIAAVAKTDNWPIDKDKFIKNTSSHFQHSHKGQIKSQE